MDPAPAPAPPPMRFPGDLAAWHHWHARNRPILQRLRARRSRAAEPGVLTIGSPAADLLVACDDRTPSLTRAVVAPLRSIDPARIAVLDRGPRTDLCGEGSTSRVVAHASELDQLLPGLRRSLTIGGHLRFGAAAHEAVRRVGGRSYVVQHGLLTRWSPPLPTGATMLAWSAQDGEFLCAGRDDLDFEVVGSELLWQAAGTQGATVDREAAPVFLGQLHAAELPRSQVIRASVRFCRANGARYRPHPSEADKVSRLTHAAMKAGGIRFADPLPPIVELGTPVVAIFSSGLVEAAVAGIPSWAYHPDPPAWVRDFWDRYDIGRWGSDPTPAPRLPTLRPAERIAQIVSASAGAES